MKFLGVTEEKLRFLIGKRERLLFEGLLRTYPVLNSAHLKATTHPNPDQAGIDPALLQEALAEQQRETRGAVLELLDQPDRYQDHELGHILQIKDSEVELFLQVLNDIRVGNWVKLGSPGMKELPDTLTEEILESAWKMEMAGHFQHHILEATNPPG